jgi:hypothetical protein
VNVNIAILLSRELAVDQELERYANVCFRSESLSLKDSSEKIK